jgi:deoxyribodipyrimidine photo-lyase
VARVRAFDLFDRPALPEQPFAPSGATFPWRDDERGWQAWVEGRTGYPVVDAAARQLLATGFVHNRARMIAASFLAKHLLIDFRRGERHYFELLTDGDWANNDLGWQWSAGCGCDAQPWFRIFNPRRRARSSTPMVNTSAAGCPTRATARALHPRAAGAPPEVLADADVRVGQNYPPRSSSTLSRGNASSKSRGNIWVDGLGFVPVKRLRTLRFRYWIMPVILAALARGRSCPPVS